MDHQRQTRGNPPLRVGLIAPPWLPVPPPSYGGTELVVDQLARGLSRRGVEVVLFSTGDATCPVERRWLHELALGTGGAPADEATHVQAAYEALAEVDLIHDHTVEGPGWWTIHPTDTPVITTVHGRFTPELRRRYLASAEHGVAVVAISDDQRWRAAPVPIADVIQHRRGRRPRWCRRRRLHRLPRPDEPGHGCSPRHRGRPALRLADRRGCQDARPR